MTGREVLAQVREALAGRGTARMVIDRAGGNPPRSVANDQALDALDGCVLRTPVEESRIARARGLAESLTLNLGPYREGSVAEIGAEIAALLTPEEPS